MLTHNLTLFFRNIVKHKGTFLINVIGMLIGLTCALLIAIWVLDEIGIDRFHKKEDRLVQVLQNLSTPNGIETDNLTHGPLAESLLNEFPEVEQAVSVVDKSWFEGEKFLLSDGKDTFFGADNQFASQNYFSMFSFPLLHGDPEQALSNSNGVVISEEMATKLFQTTNAIGKTVEWIHDEYGGTYSVSGVFKKLPENSTVQFDAVFNMAIFLEENDDLRGWNDSDLETYLVLKPQVALDTFNDKIKNFIKTKNEHSTATFFAQPYQERYLYGNYENGTVAGGRIQYVRLFSLIAILILVIACVNFINMTTAKASTRMKEIGVKKSVGAKRNRLAVQFIIESIIIAFVSMAFALIFVSLFLPQFNIITGKELDLSFTLELFIGILLIAIVTGISAGMYPAIYLSGLSTLNGLKGRIKQNLGGSMIRKNLVVFQFVVSIVLIASVFIVYKQMEFVQTKNLGFNKERVIWFSTGVLESNINEANNDEGLSEEQIEDFLQILKNTPGVVNASDFRHTMMADFGTTTGVNWPGKPEGQEAQFAQISGGYDFIETMEINLLEGRLFSRNFKTEKEKIIFNESAIKQMGMQNPIGKVITLWGEDKEIVGVVKDFHFDRLQNKVMPVFMKLDNNSFASNIMVRMDATNEIATISRIKAAYKDYFIEGMPFEWRFLDDNYQVLYEGEKRVATLSKYFAGIATLISCLGLFGLAIFTSERKSKEIGIRKVLGQSASQVVIMLSSEFTKLVLISIFIALPIAYLLANSWLSSFAYRIPLEVKYFVGAGLIALLVALLTVGSQAMRAANKNPVHALREE